MQYYFAPMEGLTDAIYRNAHHRFFPGIDRYYTPFLSPTVHRTLTPRERRELPEAQDLPYACIPQILTKVPEDFLWLANQCADLGYSEVNLNLGCPSGTVTAKGKGSGMLIDPETLDRFLDNIFQQAPLPISVKTRIGFLSTEEFPKLMDVFNRYPIAELTIHPRIRKVFYDGKVDIEVFCYGLRNSKNPVCYNGNLCTPKQMADFQSEFPTVKSVMLGRGLIADPGMLSDRRSAAVMEQFHDYLLESYIENFGSARNAMFRMKENWRFMIRCFEDSEKYGKQLRKTTDIGTYRSIVHEIFSICPMRPCIDPDW